MWEVSMVLIRLDDFDSEWAKIILGKNFIIIAEFAELRQNC